MATKLKNSHGSRFVVKLTLCLLVLSLLGLGLSTTAKAAPYFVTGQYRAYVPNFLTGTVSVIDLRRNNVVIDTIDLGNGAGSGPYGVAVSEVRLEVYVTNVFAHTLSIINAMTNKVLANVPVGSEPNGVVVNRKGTLVYVANSESDSVSVVNTATMNVIATISVGDRPVGIGINPSGTRVYVANWNSGTLSVIDTALNIVVATVPVRGNPAGVTLSPDGRTVYVVNNESIEWTGSVSAINADTNTELQGSPIELYGSPFIRDRVLPGVPDEWLAYYSIPVDAEIDCFGRTMYVSDLLGGIHIVDLMTRKVRGYIPSDGPTFGLSLKQYNMRLYAGQLELDNILSIPLTIYGDPAAGLQRVPVGDMPLGLGNFILN